MQLVNFKRETLEWHKATCKSREVKIQTQWNRTVVTVITKKQA